MPHNNKLIVLDVHEHDTAAALTYLLRLVEENRVSGMVFAVMQRHGARPIFGATGRCASNDIEAAGLSAILEDQFTQPYLRCADAD